MVPVFSNMFSIMRNEHEAVITFKHQYSSQDNMGTPIERCDVEVSSVVMTPGLMIELYHALGKVLGND